MKKYTTDSGGSEQEISLDQNNGWWRYGCEYIRLPKHGLEPISNLSRTKLCQLILPCKENGFAPPVQSVCLRKEGAKKGARLIFLRSLLEYLQSRHEGGMPPSTKKQGGAQW